MFVNEAASRLSLEAGEMMINLRRNMYLHCVLIIALFNIPIYASPAFELQEASASSKTRAALPNSEREAVGRLREETLREVTTILASNDMEGRGTAQPGGIKASQYLANQFAKLGLKPLGDSGTYLQAIKFKSSQVQRDSYVKAGDETLTLGREFVFAPYYSVEQSEVNGELVFAGYGLSSSQKNRRAFTGFDVKGKIVVLLSGLPVNMGQHTQEQKLALQQFIIRSYANLGAAGVILTNVGSEEQPYSEFADYLTRRRVTPLDAPPLASSPVIFTSNQGAEKLFGKSGLTFAQAMAKAENSDFVPQELNKSAKINVKMKIEESTGNNVVAVLEGSDPLLKEQCVVYTAHYDAYGVAFDGRIYPGAADNALGVGEMVSIAEALAKSTPRPRRSVIFLAVTGEEYGLLGAEHWVSHATWPIEKVIADLNFDGIGTEVYGPVKRVVGYGADYSNLGATLKDVTEATGTVIAPDPFPEEKIFYRSDHFAFAKKGVPALMLFGAPDGDASIWMARAKKWLTTDYHQPNDVVRSDWNWDGARTLAIVGLIAGMRVANADAVPEWLPSSPFKRTGNVPMLPAQRH